jgi:hypothetical protein
MSETEVKKNKRRKREMVREKRVEGRQAHIKHGAVGSLLLGRHYAVQALELDVACLGLPCWPHAHVLLLHAIQCRPPSPARLVVILLLVVHVRQPQHCGKR